MKRFEMTDVQMTALKKAMRPVPYIALHCGEPRSQQDNANDAWLALGKEMGFDGMTARHIPGQPPTIFEAEPT